MVFAPLESVKADSKVEFVSPKQDGLESILPPPRVPLSPPAAGPKSGARTPNGVPQMEGLGAERVDLKGGGGGGQPGTLLTSKGGGSRSTLPVAGSKI